MSINVKGNADGISGAIQVNGVDAVVFNASGITLGGKIVSNGIGSYTGTATLTTADIGRHAYYASASAGTLTLPSISGLSVGSMISISNIIGTAACTIARAGINVIYAFSQVGVTSINLNPGDSVQLITDGSNWIQVNASKITPLGTKSTSFTNAVNYLAATDGFVYGYTASGATSNQINVLSDATTTPTAVIQIIGTNTTANNFAIGFCVPIKKGNYWRIDLTAGTVPTLNFMPIGA